MGSQWATMGDALMKIPLFAESIHKSHQILKTKNVDLLKIITTNDASVFDSVLNSYVGIVAIQVRIPYYIAIESSFSYKFEKFITYYLFIFSCEDRVDRRTFGVEYPSERNHRPFCGRNMLRLRRRLSHGWSNDFTRLLSWIG